MPEVDEFGIPIKKAQVDEFGIPVKKKVGSTVSPVSPSPSPLDGKLNELKRQLNEGLLKPQRTPAPAQLQKAQQKAEFEIQKEASTPKVTQMSVFTKPTFRVEYPKDQEITAKVLGFQNRMQMEQFAEEDRQAEQTKLQNATDDFFNTTTGKLYFNVFQPMVNSASRTIGNVGATVSRAIGEDQLADQLVESFTPEKRYEGTIAGSKPTKLQGSLFNNGKMDVSKLPSKIVGGLTDMAWLLAPAGSLTKVGTAAGLSQKAAQGSALFGSSYLNSREGYYQDGKAAGLRGDQLDYYASGAAALTSSLEALFPNDIALGGFKSKMAKEYAKQIANGVTAKTALKAGLKDVLMEAGVKEPIQELSQLAGDKVAKTLTDMTSGKDNFGEQFDWEKSKDEIYETVVLTPIISVISSGSGALRSYTPSNYEKSLFFDASNNSDKVFKSLDKQASEGVITPEQYNNAKEKFTKYNLAAGQVKKLGYSDDQSMQMAWELFSGKEKLPTTQAVAADPILKDALGQDIKKDKETTSDNIRLIGMGIPAVGSEIDGKEVSFVISNIGNKGTEIDQNLVDQIGDDTYRVEDVNVKDLYNNDPAFKNYVDQYKKGSISADALMVPAVIKDGVVIDGRARLAEQYLSGKEGAKAFKNLSSAPQLSNIESLTPEQIEVTSDATDFANQMQSAQNSLGRAGMSVSPYAQEDYDQIASEGGKFLRAGDNKILALLKPNGEMVSLVKDATVKTKGAAQAMISKMKDMGGLFMDNYDIYLTPIYEKAGYKVAARVPFNEEYAPEGWNAEDSPLKNKPDVVFMVRKDFAPAEAQTFTDYEEAQNFTKGIVDNAVAQGVAQLPNNAISDELMSELGDPINDALGQAIPMATKSLEKAGIKFKVVDGATETVLAKAARGNQALFLSDDGTIIIDKSKLQNDIEAGLVVWHEASHPVMNIIRNTNKPLYDAVVRGISEAAKNNSGVADAINWAQSQEQYDNADTQNDEAIVETIGRINSGLIDVSKLDTGLRQKLIDFVNSIAKFFGIDPILDDTDLAAFKKTVSEVADALKTGRDIAEVVGEENVSQTQAPAIQARANEVFDGILDKIGISFGSVNEKTGSKKVTNFDVASALNKYYKKAFKTLRVDDFGKKALDIVSDYGTDEVIYAISKFGKESGKGWYTEDYGTALNTMQKLDPDILSNPDIKEIATVVIAISSNSTDVATNLTRIIYALDQYKKTNKIPTDVGTGKAIEAIASGVDRYNRLLQSFGGDVNALKDFLQTIRPVSESKKALIEKLGVSSYAKVLEQDLGTNPEWNENEVLPTSVIIFGPKIGAFYSNLSGLGGTPTIDRWCIRTMYRYRGDMKAKVSSSDLEGFVKENGLEGQATGNIVALADAHGKLFNAILTGKGEYKGMSKQERNAALKPYRKGSQISDKLSGVVNDIKDGITDKVENAAKYSRDFRTFTKQAFEAIQKKVEERTGEKLDISDIQAILWIYEKNLFGAMGVKQREDSTYSAAANTLVNKVESGSISLENLKAGKITNIESEGVIEDGAMGDKIDIPVKSYKEGLDGQPSRGKKSVKDQASVGNRNLAPNGKPSNLAPAQYEQVRTPQFKKWFGDWENDPANASKVVDENGEPLVVYHGSESNIDEFKNLNRNITGFYFSNDSDNAKTYGPNIENVFLNIKNPLRVDANGLKFTNELPITVLAKYPNEKPYTANVTLPIDDVVSLVKNGDRQFWEIPNREQYDGVIFDGLVDPLLSSRRDIPQDTLVAFNPNQIKSATENSGEFSTTDNRIQASVGNRPEQSREFKIAAFVMRKIGEGANPKEIAQGVASATGMSAADVAKIMKDPEQFIRDSFPELSKIAQDNLIERANIQNIYRGHNAKVNPALTGMEVPRSKVVEYLNKSNKKDKAFADSVKDFKNKWLDPAKGLPDWVMAIKDFASGSKNIEIARAVKSIERLKDEAKKIGFTDWDAFSKAMVAVRDIKRYIPDEDGVTMFDPYRASAGKMFTTPDDMLPAVIPDELKALPESIRPYAVRMRQQIDGLTKDLIGSGYVTPEQAVTLEKNLGQYVNRSYRMFNERGYKPKPDEKVNAIKFIADQKFQQILSELFPAGKKSTSKAVSDFKGNVIDPDNVDMESLHRQAFDEAEKDVEVMLNKKRNKYFNTSTDSRDTGILKEKKDIPEPIRKLMGEYTDPGTVFVMTVAKQAALKAQSEYLTKLREFGMGTMFFEKNDPRRPSDYTVEMASTGTESKSPLGGLFTNPEIAEAMEMVDPTYNKWVQVWMNIVGAVRWGKTVGSVATQAKNYLSNIGFAVLNGMFLTGKNTQSLKAAAKYVKGQYSKDEIDQITEKVIKLNLVGQSVGARELSEMLGSGDIHDIALDIAANPNNKWGKKTKTVAKPFSAANKAYRMGDDFWKVYAYINEREMVSRGRFKTNYESLTTEQQAKVDIESSERVKNTWPTYDRVVEGAKVVSRNLPIFGNFISFQAESIRVLVNSIKMAREDMKDPEMRESGIKRMVGIMTYAALRAAITTGVAHAGGMAASGILGAALGDDEEEQKKRAFKKAMPIYARPSDIAVVSTDEPHKFTAFSLSSLDPYGIIPSSLNAFTEGREGIFSKEMEPGVAAAFAEFFSGFLETEMTFSTYSAVKNNVNPKTGRPIVLDGDSASEIAKKIGSFVVDQLEPSTLSLIERGMERGWGPEVYSLAGARPIDVDFHKSFGYILSDMSKQMDAIGADYGIIKRSDKYTEQEKADAELTAERKKAFLITKISQTYRDFIKAGANPKVLDEMINDRSPIKVTGFDKVTKNAIKTGEVKSEKLFK